MCYYCFNREKLLRQIVCKEANKKLLNIIRLTKNPLEKMEEISIEKENLSETEKNKKGNIKGKDTT